MTLKTTNTKHYLEMRSEIQKKVITHLKQVEHKYFFFIRFGPYPRFDRFSWSSESLTKTNTINKTLFEQYYQVHVL